MFYCNRLIDARVLARLFVVTTILVTGHPMTTQLALFRILSIQMLTHATAETPHRLPTLIVTLLPRIIHSTPLLVIIPLYCRPLSRNQGCSWSIILPHAMGFPTVENDMMIGWDAWIIGSTVTTMTMAMMQVTIRLASGKNARNVKSSILSNIINVENLYFSEIISVCHTFTMIYGVTDCLHQITCIAYHYS